MKASKPVETSMTVRFWGLCQRAGPNQQAWTPNKGLDILGLTREMQVFFFPLAGEEFHAVLVFDPHAPRNGKLRFRNQDGDEVLSVEIEIEAVENPDAVEEMAGFNVDDIPLEAPIVAPLQGAGAIPGPGAYVVSFEPEDGEEQPLGVVGFYAPKLDPLSDEEVAAIRADPEAVNCLRIQAVCNTCGDAVRAYSGLKRNEDLEKDGFVWHGDLPPSFRCECGDHEWELGALRQNLRPMLREIDRETSNLAVSRLYEQRTLRRLADELEQLLDEEPEEQALQDFLQDNPIALYFLEPEKLFYTPEILNEREADFAALTPRTDLIYVEIETPQTGLLTQSGDRHHELNHAIDQVADWFHLTDEHRQAVLRGLGLERYDVGAVRGLVIAGRDSGYDQEHLRQLKSRSFDGIHVYTWDDLLGAIRELARRFEEL